MRRATALRRRGGGSALGRPRRAIVMWLVLSVSVVMGILMFSFNVTVRQRNAQAHALYFSQVAYGLAEAGVNLAWRSIRDQAGSRESELHRQALTRTCQELVGFQVPLAVDPGVRDELFRDLGRCELTVRATVLAARPLTPPGAEANGVDPVEKELRIRVTSTAWYRDVRRVVEEQREVRLQLDVLPVLSRFTLFVKEPEREDATSPGYNLFANEINGQPDTSTVGADQNYLPLVLYHHGDTTARIHHDLEQNGWVYLGGTQPVKLNLTSGGDYRYGEYFHFYDFLSQEGASPAAFINDAPPPWFSSPHQVFGSEHTYYLKHVLYGYFTIDEGEPPGDMNKNSALDRYFDAGATMRSNVLHLYGSTLCPSPTRVFGPVFHSYPIYSGVTVDADGDGLRDGLVTLLPAIDGGSFGELPELAPLPISIRSISNPGALIYLDPAQLTYEAMFGDFDTYEAFQSLIVEQEAYNAGLDYMASHGAFPPTTHVLDPARDYPNLGDDLTLRARDDQGRPTGDPYFRGDLDGLGAELFRGRTFVRFPDPASFLRAYVRDGGVLDLGAQVYVAGGPLVLPDNLTVRRGGLVAVEGSVAFDGVTCAAGERLALVSLTGNVTSAFHNATDDRPAAVDLVALAGRVGSTGSGRRFYVRGTVAARRFDPRDFKGGGLLIYPREADPGAPARLGFARLHVADLADLWSL